MHKSTGAKHVGPCSEIGTTSAVIAGTDPGFFKGCDWYLYVCNGACSHNVAV